MLKEKTQQNYHTPVLLEESIESLQINPNGKYVDLTFGGGGYSNKILEKLNKGKLIAFDQDQDAADIAKGIQSNSFNFINSNFSLVEEELKEKGISEVDGIVADLGVSSHQIDTEERGFSFRFDSMLDMRMNINQDLTAKNIVNEYSIDKLATLFGAYGELEKPYSLAKAIIIKRTVNSINTVNDLKEVLQKFSPYGRENKFFAKVFQALRIEVNDELNALKKMLLGSLSILKSGGRVVIISYHSLEDRLVKRFFKTGNFKGEIEKDFFGNIIRPLEPLNIKVIKASEQEIKTNNRSRSARLRVASKFWENSK